MALCSSCFFIQVCHPRWKGSYRVLHILPLKIKSPHVSEMVIGQSSGEPLFLILFIWTSLRSAITQFLSRAVLCLCSVSRNILRFCFFFWKYKVTLKFLVLQNLETQARVEQIHHVTNKLLNPRVSVAIKKVLGALVGWNGKRVFCH